MENERDEMTAALMYGVEVGKDSFRKRVRSLEKILRDFLSHCELRDCKTCVVDHPYYEPCETYKQACALLGDTP